MSNPFIIKKNTELTRPLFKTALGGFFGTKNAEAHRFEISLFRNGERVQLQNSNIVTAAFVNYSNMVTVLLSDEYTSVEGGNAIVVLSDGCYQLPGRFCLTINVDDVTVFAGEGTLSETQTDSIYDPDDIVPSLEDVLAQVDAARQAATAANEAAANASKTPFIGDGNVWYFWDADRGMYVASENKSIPALTFQAVTGAPGTNVQLVQTGTPDAPVITLTIPRGDTGAVDGIDYFTGSPSALGTASPGTANGVARGDHVHQMPTAEDVGALAQNSVLDALYPVGIIVPFANAVEPAALWGGTWELIEEGRTIIQSGSAYPLGSMGGSATHTLTIDEMPAHTHNVKRYSAGGIETGNGLQTAVNVNCVYDSGYGALSTGGNQAHSIMQPYLAVNIWMRTA